MSKIAIFGLGAIGSLLSKYLLKNKNNQLFFFNRSSKKAIQINFEGKIESYPIELEKSNQNSFDWIIVCLKTYHLPVAKAAISQLIKPGTKIAIFRNGLNLSADFLDVLPNQNILETIIDCSVQRQSDASYLQLSIPKIILLDSTLAQTFKQLFADAEIDIQLTNKFKEAQWKKLIESSSLGALQAIHEKPCVIFKDPKILAEYEQLIRESIVVANSDGVSIPAKFAEVLLEKLKSYPDHKGSSMLADKLAGRPIELNAKIGIIVKIGIENGVDMSTLTRVLWAVEFAK